MWLTHPTSRERQDSASAVLFAAARGLWRTVFHRSPWPVASFQAVDSVGAPIQGSRGAFDWGTRETISKDIQRAISGVHECPDVFDATRRLGLLAESGLRLSFPPSAALNRQAAKDKRHGLARIGLRVQGWVPGPTSWSDASQRLMCWRCEDVTPRMAQK